ncbi:MAG TPA: hypothetical protein ENL06_03160, partial [Candidatus Portnoybacteria bacterium]|nr:hypothetical protein [Candidatus Portnoybacteria bacterium]
METENLFKLTKEYFKAALLWGILIGGLSFLVLVVTQKNFCSSADILISQDQPNANYYALSQSANYLTYILSQSIYSEKFLEEVEATGKIPGNFLKGDSAQKIEAWQKIIRVKNDSDVGIMNIKVFADTPIQANKISQAVLEVIAKKGSFFLGQNENINVRVLSGPIVEENPSFSQLML